MTKQAYAGKPASCRLPIAPIKKKTSNLLQDSTFAKLRKIADEFIDQNLYDDMQIRLKLSRKLVLFKPNSFAQVIKLFADHIRKDSVFFLSSKDRFAISLILRVSEKEILLVEKYLRQRKILASNGSLSQLLTNLICENVKREDAAKSPKLPPIDRLTSIDCLSQPQLKCYEMVHERIKSEILEKEQRSFVKTLEGVAL